MPDTIPEGARAPSTPALKPVCPRCGSDDIVRDASVRWNADAQCWALSDVYDCDFCGECHAEGDLIVRWASADGAAAINVPPVVGARVRIRERARIGGDRFKGREGEVVRPHRFAGFYVRLDTRPRERVQKTELVEAAYLDVLSLPEPSTFNSDQGGASS